MSIVNQPRRKEIDFVLAFLVATIILTAFTSGLSVDVGAVTINASQVLVAFLLGYLVLCSAAGKYRVPVLFKDDVSFFLYLFFLSNLFSSIVFSDQKLQSIKGCIALLGYVLIFTGVRSGIGLLKDPERATGRLRSFNIYSAVFGLGCMMLAVITGNENVGVTFGHLSIGAPLLGIIPPSIKALSVEPNLFAIGTATILCLALGRYLLGESRRGELPVILLLSLAVLFAYTRSVYGAVLIAVFIMMVLSRRTRVLKKVFVVSAAVVLVIVILGFALPDEHPIRRAFVDRVSTLVDFKGGTGGGRVQGYIFALEGFWNRPILGNGTFSAHTEVFNSSTGRYEERMGGPGWLTGSWIQALHDTGIVGFIILFSFFGLLIRANYRLFSRLPTTDVNKSIALGFLGGNIILIVTSQLSSPLWIAFPYIYWGINMEFISRCRKHNG